MTKTGTPSDLLSRHPASTEGDHTWIDEENAACHLRDERLKKRFRLLLKQFWGSMGQSIPFACQDWANTKAAYRFFSNDHVSEQAILGGHFQATSERFAKSDGPILVLQDTTTFSYQREHPERIGFTGKSGTCKVDGRIKLEELKLTDAMERHFKLLFPAA